MVHVCLDSMHLQLTACSYELQRHVYNIIRYRQAKGVQVALPVLVVVALMRRDLHESRVFFGIKPELVPP